MNREGPDTAMYRTDVFLTHVWPTVGVHPRHPDWPSSCCAFASSSVRTSISCSASMTACLAASTLELAFSTSRRAASTASSKEAQSSPYANRNSNIATARPNKETVASFMIRRVRYCSRRVPVTPFWQGGGLGAGAEDGGLNVLAAVSGRRRVFRCGGNEFQIGGGGGKYSTPAEHRYRLPGRVLHGGSIAEDTLGSAVFVGALQLLVDKDSEGNSRCPDNSTRRVLWRWLATLRPQESYHTRGTTLCLDDEFDI